MVVSTNDTVHSLDKHTSPLIPPKQLLISNIIMAVDVRHSSGWQIKKTQLHVQEKGWSKNQNNKRTMLAASLHTWPAAMGMNTRTNCQRVRENTFPHVRFSYMGPHTATTRTRGQRRYSDEARSVYNTPFHCRGITNAVE